LEQQIVDFLPRNVRIVLMKEREKGHLIVIEGGLGAGKTTVKKGLEKELKDWKFLREPGGTGFGEMMREAVQGDHQHEVDPLASFLSYSASRANLVALEILPAINEGTNVLLDRFWYSSYAYQGEAEGVEKEFILAVSARVSRGLEPDLVLHYDLMPEIGKKRKSGCDDVDRYDKREIEFHCKVRKAYMELSEMYPDIWRTIDASQKADKVLQDSLEILEEFGLL